MESWVDLPLVSVIYRDSLFIQHLNRYATRLRSIVGCTCKRNSLQCIVVKCGVKLTFVAQETNNCGVCLTSARTDALESYSIVFACCVVVTRVRLTLLYLWKKTKTTTVKEIVTAAEKRQYKLHMRGIDFHRFHGPHSFLFLCSHFHFRIFYSDDNLLHLSLFPFSPDTTIPNSHFHSYH